MIEQLTPYRLFKCQCGNKEIRQVCFAKKGEMATMSREKTEWCKCGKAFCFASPFCDYRGVEWANEQFDKYVEIKNKEVKK